MTDLKQTLIKNIPLKEGIKNALRRNGIICLDDLLKLDYEEIVKIKGIGPNRIKELRDYIHSLGYTFINERKTTREIKEEYKKLGIPTLEEVLGVDHRVLSPLYKNGIYTLDDLFKYGKKVLELDGIGASTSIQIRKLFKHNNYEDEIEFTKEIINDIEQENNELDEEIKEKELLLEELTLEYNKLFIKRRQLLYKKNKLDEEIKEKQELLESPEPEKVKSYKK